MDGEKVEKTMVDNDYSVLLYCRTVPMITSSAQSFVHIEPVKSNSIHCFYRILSRRSYSTIADMDGNQIKFFGRTVCNDRKFSIRPRWYFG